MAEPAPAIAISVADLRVLLTAMEAVVSLYAFTDADRVPRAIVDLLAQTQALAAMIRAWQAAEQERCCA